MCQNGLEILSLLVNRLKEDFRPYIQTILHAVIDRLGRYSPPLIPKKYLSYFPFQILNFCMFYLVIEQGLFLCVQVIQKILFEKRLKISS